MGAARRGTGFWGVSALALWLGLTGLPARAENTNPSPLNPRYLETAPPAAHAAEPAPGFMAMSPAHGDSFIDAPDAPPSGGPDSAAPAEAVPPVDAAPKPSVDAAAQPDLPDALPPVNAALKAALEAGFGVHDSAALPRREHEAVAAFYAARGFAPLWWSDSKPNDEAAPVIKRLQHAADDGLDVKGVPRTLSATTDEGIAAADIALTDAVVAYGRQASGGRVDPHMISKLIGETPEVADPAVVLALVATAGAGAGDELQKFNPPQKAYAALREKLLQLRHGQTPAARDAAIPAGPVLRAGMRDPRVPLIRARLSVEDSAESAIQNIVYDTKVAAAVADFQKANGLPPSGTLTARTVAALSGAQSSHLEAEIIANMERWRWMPRDLGEARIEVNIPNYEARVIENGAVIHRTRVIVGKEKTPTPIFSDTMKFLIVNPYWNVPQSIIRKEMLPKAAGDPKYFSRLGYQVSSRAGHLVVRQPPGERNALGRIKFMFPNDFSVYMHDTPTRKLFASSKRAFSHGCVRVDNPFQFAVIVLGKGWSEQRVKKLIGGKERYVYLPKPLPVHLEYFTAYVDESGELQLRDDIYGYSHGVKAALGLEGNS
jgi:L,D-transpeptidase YcbB